MKISSFINFYIWLAILIRLNKTAFEDKPKAYQKLSCKLKIEEHSLAYEPCKLFTNDECQIESFIKNRHEFHVNILYISTALMLPSIFIYLIYSNLYILKSALQRNLIAVIILKNIVTILIKKLIILDSLKALNHNKNALENNGFGCKVLAFLEDFFYNGIFTYFLANTYYLHQFNRRLIKFDLKKLIIHGGITVLSFIPTMIWAILIGIKKMKYCWLVEENWYKWITNSYKFIVFVLTIILLIDIMRIFILKLKEKTTFHQTKATFRATIFLVPFFGIPLICTSNVFHSESCKVQNIFYYVIYTIEALQGILASILYCYLSNEVHYEIANSYKRWKLRFLRSYFDNDFDMGRRKTTNSNYPRASNNELEDWLPTIYDQF